MKKLTLSQGKYAFVDDDDFLWLNQWKWTAHLEHNNWYALRSTGSVKKRKIIRLHRLIIAAPKGELVDHINGNSLDNRRSNLRICSNQENLCNRDKPKQNTSGFKGVSWDKQMKKWRASITKNGKTKFLGLFLLKADAAKAYDFAVFKFHGIYAKPNF